jgi:hypothetical protein
MKKGIKIFFLFLAFGLPVCIFVFLKLFGRNEFDVTPLYLTESPPQVPGCPIAEKPYHVPDSVLSSYLKSGDSLAVIVFPPLSGEALNQLDRIREQTANDAVRLTQGVAPEAAGTPDASRIRQCAFFLDGDVNIVMIDRRGVIRGQYNAADRDEVDRLLTEITILLRKY